VTSAKLTIDVLNQAAGQQAKVSQTEMAYRDELATLEAKANALAAGLERLQTANERFKFAREKPLNSRSPESDTPRLTGLRGV
jgi:hypothetical protein